VGRSLQATKKTAQNAQPTIHAPDAVSREYRGKLSLRKVYFAWISLLIVRKKSESFDLMSSLRPVRSRNCRLGFKSRKEFA
jgi:hypothetical protein